MVLAVDAGARLEPAAREVVRRRHVERQRELRGSSRAWTAPEQGGAHLGRRAGRSPDADLFRSLPAGQPVRQRPEVAGRRPRRPRRDLPAARARAGHRHAGVRQDRGGALGRVRRLQLRVASRPHQRRAGHAPHHRRRRLAPRPGGAAEADGRRRPRRHAVDQTRRRRPAAARRAGAGACQGRTRSLVPPADAGRVLRV